MAARIGTRPKDHTVLGLDIGTRFIKVAEMRLTKGTIALLNVAARPTPSDVIDSSQILDPVGLGRAIRELLSLHRIKTKTVVVSICGQSSVVVRPIELPRMTPKELKDTMKFEVERHIPFAADEVIMDYAPIGDPDSLPETEANMKVLLAVAQEELINAYLKVLKVAGLKPKALDVEILSAIRALVDIHAEVEGHASAVAMVNIGAANTDISIIDKGDLTFTRTVPIAGDALSQAIADHLAISFDEAEELKKLHGRVFPASLFEDEEDEASAPAASAPVEEEPDDPDPFVNAFAAGTTPGGLPPISPNIFSLDDDFDTAGPLDLAAASPSDAGGTSAISFGAPDDDDETPSFMRFAPDEGDAPAPATPFTLDDASAGGGTTVFSLDADGPTAPPSVIQAEATPGAAPVFDLHSELEGQLPPSRQRPMAQEATEETPGLMAAASAPLDLAAPTGAPGTETYPADDMVMPLTTVPAVPAAPMPDPAAEMPFAADAAPTEAPEAFPLAPPAEVTGSATSANLLGMEQTVVLGEGQRRTRDEAMERKLFDAMLPSLLELVTEIRRSLEYYSTRDPDTPIERIVVFGGTGCLPDFAEFIHHEIGLEVEIADPIQALDTSRITQPMEYVRELAPALPVCVGLGLRDMLA